MIKKIDKKNKFVSVFNPDTGFYMRTGILDENGKDTGVDPFMTSYPELLDIGIMGRCEHGSSGLCIKSGVQCYQDGLKVKYPNMTFDNFKKIVDECKGKTFQCLDGKEVVLVKSKYGNISSKYIKDIHVGDYIFYKNKTFVKVIEKNEKISDVYKIKLNYGKSIIATSEHQFPTNSGLKKVSDLKISDELICARDKVNIDPITKIDIVKLIIEAEMDDKYFLTDCPGLSEICKKMGIIRNANKTVKISLIKEFLSDIDYSNAKISKERSQYQFQAVYNITHELMVLLGHFIGNGSWKTYTISKTQIKMIETIENALINIFPNFKYKKTYVGNACKIELSSTVLHKDLFGKIFKCRTQNDEKQLPNFIFAVSNDLKLSFLRGYFCDGNFQVNTNDGHYGKIVFNTSSEKLAKDIGILLVSMGVDYSMRSENGKQEIFSKKEPRIINRKTRYRIIVENLLELKKITEVVFDHKNSKTFYDMINDYHNNNYLKFRKGYIVQEVEKLNEQRLVVDINVDSNEHLFMTSNGIISHNCALGGRGDVDQHEDFEKILRYCRENGIVPNFTSSGLGFTDNIVKLCKELCGAVAISWYRQEHTYKAIQMLLYAGVKTNIHYVLGNNSIDEAIERLKKNDPPKGINAIIFLLHKPVGLGQENNVLNINDERVKEFFHIIDTQQFDFKIGFDSCTVPALINMTSNINRDSFDTCEGARWSAYITSDMKMLPCSFDNQDMRWAYDISNDTIENAWNSEQFEDFRNHFRNSCKGCADQDSCMGGCPIRRQIVLCSRKEKNLYEGTF